MENPSSAQTHRFEAEVSQVLSLVINSLYSHKEIFLRELVSNASDACDRLRFAAIANSALLAEDPELGIRIDADPAAGTVTVTDNGIGMTREEAITNLGTIARSGTAEFFRGLSGDEQKASQLIGQFGVGFYSAFIVADRVEVRSRKAGEPASAGVRWESAAEGDFTVESVTLPARGTAADAASGASTAAIAFLFFLYGARLSTREAIDGLRHWRLHVTVLACTSLASPKGSKSITSAGVRPASARAFTMSFSL